MQTNIFINGIQELPGHKWRDGLKLKQVLLTDNHVFKKEKMPDRYFLLIGDKRFLEY